ncbi:MAG: hypothetical protein ACI91F_002169 [Candidatus Binatia bacterium]
MDHEFKLPAVVWRRFFCAIVACTLGVAAGQAFAKPSDKQISGTVCVIDLGEASYEAVFGYENDGGELEIPIGPSDNFVTPAPHDRGQPTRFFVGVIDDVFRVRFMNENIIWHIGRGGVTTASSRTHACDSLPNTTSTTSTTLPTSTTSTRPGRLAHPRSVPKLSRALRSLAILVSKSVKPTFGTIVRPAKASAFRGSCG